MLLRLLLAAWFILAGLSAAHADPISIILGIGSWIAGAGAFVQALLGIALKIGVSLIEKALAPKEKEPGIQSSITVGGDNPLSFVMGHFATAGQLEYANTWGNDGSAPNGLLTQVISLADMPVGSLTGLWVDDKKVTLPDMSGPAPLSRGYPIAEYTKDGSRYLCLYFFDGTQTDDCDFLTSQFGSDPDRPWSNDMIGRGVPYVVITAKFKQSMFSGIPQYLFEVDGVRQYDVRKDSTAGGSGAHRWATPSTWEVSDNPIVMAYNIIRGIYFGDEWVYGGQTTEAYQLPAANWMAAMNICDASVSLAGGGTEKQYRAGCQITTDQEPADVLESILKGCSGRLAEVGGMYKVTVGAPGAAVYSFTDESIVVTEGQSLDPFPGLESTYNGAQASYPEPAEKWAAKDAPAYLRTDLEVLDDNRRLVTGLTFPTVPYAVQVQRLLQEAILDSRRFRQHQFFLPPEAWLLEPGDVVAWTSNRNSYSNKKFLITEIDGGSNFLQLASLKEVDPSDFTWDPETDQQPYSVGPVGPILPPPQPMTGWQVFPDSLDGNDGSPRKPTIRVEFPGALDDVQFVRVQVRLDDGDVLQFDGTLPYGDPATNPDPVSVKLVGTFVGRTDYEARGIFVPYSGRDAVWSDWLPVTTDAETLPALSVGLAQIQQDMLDLFTQISVSLQGYKDQMAQLAAAAVEAAGRQVQDNSAVRRFKDATAVALRSMTASIEETEAGLLAQAEILDAVQATVGDASSGILWRMRVVAGTGDVTAQLVLDIRATVADAFVTAGTLWEAGFVGGDPLQPFSRMVTNVKQWVVTDGTDSGTPLTFEDGELKALFARFGTATMDLFKTTSGKTQIGTFSGGAEGIRIIV
ncbi:phage tail protein [Mesorhizobium sp. B2-1-3A]|uniref:phage tail protein n=1 Tax=Mesorhizobium sp. B2-1-3A TaxID=2589971 RepID=UPI001128D5B4|nr:phage tail protein [Mesorhizobium sp. B2-1-3A]TPM92735.1 hypothetical protein FJ977_28045 [Mesorhizobium sp. B2-1-3A]